MSKNFHENLAEDSVRLPSERSTGLVFAGVVLIVAYFWRANASVFIVALGAAVVLTIVSLLRPSLLRPLNVAWFKFGLLLNKIVSPVVMLVLFAVVIVPFGLVMQLRADPLRKRRQPDAKSYWIERDDSTPKSSMANQF
jgi:hypothetical protein